MEPSEHVKALCRIGTGRGLADPDLRMAIQPFIAEAGRVTDAEADEDVLSRLVWALPVDVAERNRKIFLTAANVQLDISRSRPRRLAAFWQESGESPVADHRVREIIKIVATSLVGTTCAPPAANPLPGRPGQEHRLEEMDVYIDVPFAGKSARRIAEAMVVTPRHEVMNLWRGQRTVVDKDRPSYEHFGAGRFADPIVGSGDAVRLRVDFDPPATTPQKFTIAATYAVETPNGGFSWYGNHFPSQAPRRYAVEAQFGQAPVAAYWVSASLSADFPLRPDSAENVEIILGRDGRAMARKQSSEGLENCVVGLVWFWENPRTAGFELPGSAS